MKNRKSSDIKPLDIVICLAVIALAVLIWIVPVLTRGDGREVVVTVGDEETVYGLTDTGEYIIENNGHTLTLVIEDGCAYVTHADCPDKLCEKSGKISNSGETIACVPAGIVIRIVSAEGYDAVAS